MSQSNIFPLTDGIVLEISTDMNTYNYKGAELWDRFTIENIYSGTFLEFKSCLRGYVKIGWQQLQ